MRTASNGSHQRYGRTVADGSDAVDISRHLLNGGGRAELAFSAGMAEKEPRIR
jgi:hypothetical protein